MKYQMKQYILFITLVLCSAVASAQSNSYESWRKQKEAEYSRWMELRAETAGVPASKDQQRVSRFIEEGFGKTVASPAARPPATGGAGVVAAPSTMKVWAVVVGVAAYRHIDKLNYTDDDAYRMYAFYKSPEGGSLPDSQIRVLIDEEATRSNVTGALKAIVDGAAPGDAIVFYFSGHGAREAFLTHEYNGRSDDLRGLLLHREIQEVFDRSAARFKYIIADACHSGQWAQQGMAGGYYQAFDRPGGGSVLLLSSMGDEYSIESSGVRQGVFSHYLIRGLKGEADVNADRVVSVAELFDFVKSNVVQSTHHRQTPVLSGDYRENPPVSVVRDGNSD
jgi:uncharacterized caspase-like protein